MKKVKCIDDSNMSYITKGEIYKLVKEDGNYFRIINSTGEEVEYYKNRFEEVKGEKPKTFAILGKPNLVKAIWEDLKELGYKAYSEGSDRIFDIIVNSNSTHEKLGNFKNLYIGSYLHGTSHIKLNRDYFVEFNLPQDYQKALDYAKEALNPENWGEQDQIKIGQYPAQFIENTVTFGCKTNITLEEAQALRTVFTLSGRVGNVNFEQEETFCIDGNEIQVDILDKVIKKLKDG